MRAAIIERPEGKNVCVVEEPVPVVTPGVRAAFDEAERERTVVSACNLQSVFDVSPWGWGTTVTQAPMTDGDVSAIVAAKLKQARREQRKAMERLVGFIWGYGGPCYRGWNDTVLREYLEFHAAHKTLTWCQVRGRTVGCAVIWPCAEDWLRFGQEHAVNWEAPDWSADSIYFADWIARGPGVLGAMARTFWERFPEARGKKWFCHRDGRLVRFDGTGMGRRLLK